MKRLISLFLLVALLISLCACETEKSSSGLKIVLNGEGLDAYTMHYDANEEYAVIPLTAFLQSLGAVYGELPENNGHATEIYSFAGKRYVVIDAQHLFILESDYYALLDYLEQEGKLLSQLSKNDLSAYGLLPLSECKICSGSTHSGEILTDHFTLMNALTESGIDITINYDYSKMLLDVTLIL